MKKRSTKKKLAASFVVTISVGGAIGTAGLSAEGCKKHTGDGNGLFETDAPNVYRNADGTGASVCYFSYPEHCPRGAACNPPPPEAVDCPPNLRDAATDPPNSPRRPVGKEDWLRIRPIVYIDYPETNNGCSYRPEHFCAVKGKPECTEQPPNVKTTCTVNQDSGVRMVSAFVYKDGLGECRRVPDSECVFGGGRGGCFVPDGDVVPCPK